MANVNLLKKLEIDEVSSVRSAANPYAKILLMKRDRDNDAADIIDEATTQAKDYLADIFADKNIVDKGAEIIKMAKSFVGYLKSNVMKDMDGVHIKPAVDIDDTVTYDGDSDVDTRSTRTPQPNDRNDISVLPEKLEGMVAAIIAAAPSLQREQAVHFLMHTARGRSVANHLANITKGNSMPNTEEELRKFVKVNTDGMMTVAKFVLDNKEHATYSEAEFSAALMTFADLNKNGKESRYQAFDRILTNAVDRFDSNHDIYRALNVVKGYPDVMPTKPSSVEVGSTLDPEDGRKAYDESMAMARKLHAASPAKSVQQFFAQIMQQRPDLEQRTRGLTEQDLRGSKRPTASSTSGDELQAR